MWSTKIVPGTYLESLVKIESVTAEIFLIWRNATRTNVGWENVTVTVGMLTVLTQGVGVGVQNYGKHADIIGLSIVFFWLL